MKKNLEDLEDDKWTQDPSGPEILEFTAEPGLKVTVKKKGLKLLWIFFSCL